MVRRDRTRSLRSRLVASAASAASSGLPGLPGLRRRGAGKPGALMRRAQQWLVAREQLLSRWIVRARERARRGMLGRAVTRRSPRVGGAGAIVLPQWWEYESPLKRKLALEATLRRMFSLVPEASAA